MENALPLNIIKEEIELETKEIDSFEFAEEDKSCLSDVDKEGVLIKQEKEEESYLPDEIKVENVINNEMVAEDEEINTDEIEFGDKTHQSKFLEFICVKAEKEEEEEWAEPSGCETDPLAIPPALEAVVKTRLSEEEESPTTNIMDTQTHSESTWSNNSALDQYRQKSELHEGKSDNENSLEYTKNSYPSEQKRYKHALCNYSTRSLDSLKNHSEAQNEDNKFRCTVCVYSASRPSTLERHIRTHSGDKPYKCMLCDYKATRTSNLKEHIRIHTGEKPYKCTMCKYASTNIAALRKHTMIHLGEKPYKCSMCDYAATQSSALKEHIRVHTGEKPFKCTFCDYTTARSSKLNEHKRVHTGEKPYKCKICDYCAALSSTLKHHMKRHARVCVELLSHSL